MGEGQQTKGVRCKQRSHQAETMVCSNTASRLFQRLTNHYYFAAFEKGTKSYWSSSGFTCNETFALPPPPRCHPPAGHQLNKDQSQPLRDMPPLTNVPHPPIKCQIKCTSVFTISKPDVNQTSNKFHPKAENLAAVCGRQRQKELFCFFLLWQQSVQMCRNHVKKNQSGTGKVEFVCLFRGKEICSESCEMPGRRKSP